MICIFIFGFHNSSQMINENQKPWVSVTERLKEIAKLDANQPRKKFVILGAGIAGLVAAYELRLLGHEVEIIEATNRVGGRILTYRFSDGQYGELGAMRIPGSHDYVHHYVKQLGLKLRPFIDYTNNGFYDIRNITARRQNVLQDLVPAFNLTSAEHTLVKEHGIGMLLTSIVSSEVQQLSWQEKINLFEGKITTERLEYLDKTSARGALKERWSSEAVSLIGTTTSLETLWNRPLSKYVRDALMENSLGLVELVGGMDLLPTKFSENIDTQINFNSEVISLQKLADGTARLVTSENGGQPKERDCNYVLCTLPFGVLRKIPLSGMSVGKMEAVRNLSYVSATKVLLHSRSRFWETKYGIYGGRSISDGISRQTYYPSDNAAISSMSRKKIDTVRKGTQLGAWGIHTGPEMTPLKETNHDANKSISGAASEGPGVLLGSYTWGSDARRIGALSPDERAITTMKSILRFHPEIFECVDDYYSVDWEQNRWSGGAYADLLPSDLTDYYQNGIIPEGNVHFAGEHLSPFPGWIQGAIYSSLRALAEMLR